MSSKSKTEAVADPSSDSSSSEESAPGVSRCDSGSASFGPNAQQTAPIDPYTLFMIAFEYGDQKYEIDILNKNEVMPAILARANEMSPLLVDHIAKGMGDRIVTRRKRERIGATTRSKAKAKSSKAKAIKGPKLLKQLNKDLAEERGEVLYTWMFIAERKNSTYHYYLLSNKVKSRIEFGTKHFMIEKKYTDLMGKAPDRIYLTGEFRATPGRLEYNFISGTYMAKKFENLQSMSVDTRPIEEKFSNALNEYFPKMDVVHTSNSVEDSFIPSPKNKILTEKEWIYVQDLFGPYLRPIDKFYFCHNDRMTKREYDEYIAETKKQQNERIQQRMISMSNNHLFKMLGKKTDGPKPDATKPDATKPDATKPDGSK
jgi:hypothetical protein